MVRTNLSRNVKYLILQEEIKNTQNAIATYFQIDSVDDILVTNGATGALDCVFRAYSCDQKRPKSLSATFDYYDAKNLLKYAKVSILNVGNFPKYPVTKIICALKKEQYDIFYLSTPVNPTGEIITDSDLEKLIQASSDNSTHLVVDFSLIHKNMHKRITDFWQRYYQHNLSVIVSFSKSHNLIGERVGCVIDSQISKKVHPFAHCPATPSLQRIRNELHSDTYLNQKLLDVQKSAIILRECFLEECFDTQKEFEFFVSETNFSLIKVPISQIKNIKEALHQEDISVVWGENIGLPKEYFRIDMTNEIGIKRLTQMLRRKI